ncbi:hypothetical protein C8R43DRAFT_586076 [Mycena crocata]|nr:hypothetical protein C8R43DRAFT_586076 [Mycena crocata]
MPLALDLPYELTSDIFLRCLPSHRRIRPGRKLAPLQLSQICSQWRAVALATPELWSSIYLEFTPQVPYDAIPWLFNEREAGMAVDYTCDLVELWLARSATFPLSITLLCRGEGIRLPPKLLLTISKHCAHWDRLELAVTPPDLRDFNEISGPFPLLRSLAVCLRGERWEPAPRLGIRRCSVNLKSLTLCDQYRRPLWPIDYEDIPSSVVALKIAQRLGSWDDLFLQFPHIRHLSSAGEETAFPRLPPDREYSPIASSLTSLQLPQRYIILLDCLDIPPLEDLDVYVSSPAIADRLTAFLSRSARRLRQLTLRFYEGGDHLIPCLVAAASVHTLHLCFYEDGATRESIASRYQFLHRADVAPGLRALIITDLLRVAGTYAPFLAVLHARPALERAELHMRPHIVDRQRNLAPPDREITAQFETLLARGIDVWATTPECVWPLPSLSTSVARDDRIPSLAIDDIFAWDKTSACISSYAD